MKVDVAKMTLTLQQVMTLANLGAAVVTAGAGVVSQVLDILRARGYEADTAALDELIIDAERRRLIAEQESEAQF